MASDAGWSWEVDPPIITCESQVVSDLTAATELFPWRRLHDFNYTCCIFLDCERSFERLQARAANYTPTDPISVYRQHACHRNARPRGTRRQRYKALQIRYWLVGGNIERDLEQWH